MHQTMRLLAEQASAQQFGMRPPLQVAVKMAGIKQRSMRSFLTLPLSWVILAGIFPLFLLDISGYLLCHEIAVGSNLTFRHVRLFWKGD